ncbi:MAG: alpha/beta fold hydrolase [Rubripirellula sp.]|nr:alpha/beta fold hydrolase [Rubripirellula sp.]
MTAIARRVLVTTALMVISWNTPHLAATEPVAFDQIAALVDQAVARGDAAGAVHLVGRGGTIIHSHQAGVRDVNSGAPIGSNTVVRIYSMTKPITSVAAMTLYEQGKFQLDDPVSKYIPAFKQSSVWDGEKQQAIAPKRPITVRDVFRHTTGFAYGGNGNAEVDRRYHEAGLKYRPPQAMLPPEMTIEEAAIKMAGIPAHHHPGERFTYGFSTDLLGRLIEVWSGVPLDQYLQRAVLQPLEMQDTAFSVPADRQSRFASCHTKRQGKLAIVDPCTDSPFVDGFQFLSGGGGLMSTTADYAKFCQMLVGDGVRNETQILKPETLQLMFTDQLADVPGQFRFGLGFAINDIEVGSGDESRSVKQYSWGGYASTDFRIVPELGLYQIFVRQHVPSQHQLAGQAFDQVYRNYDQLVSKPGLQDGDVSGQTPASDTEPASDTQSASDTESASEAQPASDTQSASEAQSVGKPEPTDLGTHGFVDSDGVKLHYVTRGQGKLLVMLHGFPDYWYTWREQIPALAEHFQVVAIDLRGYNWSDQPEGVQNYTLDKLVGDVEAVIDHFGQEQAIVVGHDWGGMIAWTFAMQRPERTEKLVVLNLPHPAGLTRELANNPDQQAASAYAREFQKPDAASRLNAQGLTFWVKDPEARRKYVQAFQRSSFEAMLNFYKANYPRPPYQAQQEFPKVKCPVLLLHGLGDTALLPEGLNGTWNQVQNELTLVTIPGASHFVQQDAAASVTGHLVRWLTGLTE